jgi:hypothetical protein
MTLDVIDYCNKQIEIIENWGVDGDTWTNRDVLQIYYSIINIVKRRRNLMGEK